MQIVWLSRARIAREKAITTALNQLDEIERQVDLLVAHPKLGRIGRVKGTRELVISRTPFIVLYRVIGNKIQVLNFLQTSQQLPK